MCRPDLTGWTASSCLAVAVLAGFCLSSPAQAVTEAEALKDWNALEDAYKAFDEKLADTVAAHAANIIDTDYDAVLGLLKEVEKKDIPRLEKQLAQFENKYGKTPEEIDEAIENAVELDWNSGKHPRRRASDACKDLHRRIEEVGVAKQKKVEEFLRNAESIQSRIASGSLSGEILAKNYGELEGVLDLALKFDPKNAKAKELTANIAKDKKQTFAALEKAIDEAKWPGHSPKFGGPGDPDKLCASAMKWLQNDEANRGDKTPDHTFAVCVRGDWWVAKRNLLGEPIQWGLPIWGACYDAEEKSKGICRVFSLTILTQEGANVEKAPPWTGVTVGDLYKMRIANVKGGRAAGGGTSGGFVGFVFRLLLVAANLAAGLLLAAPLLKGKVALLGTLEAKLVPLSKQVGIAVLVIAVLSLLRAIVLCHFALFSDLLPQAAGIAAGLCLVKKPLLEKFTPKIGLACLILAILHLLLARLPLV